MVHHGHHHYFRIVLADCAHDPNLHSCSDPDNRRLPRRKVRVELHLRPVNRAASQYAHDHRPGHFALNHSVACMVGNDHHVIEAARSAASDLCLKPARYTRTHQRDHCTRHTYQNGRCSALRQPYSVARSEFVMSSLHRHNMLCLLPYFPQSHPLLVFVKSHHAALQAELSGPTRTSYPPQHRIYDAHAHTFMRQHLSSKK